jgi:hypothetical protein
MPVTITFSFLISMMGSMVIAVIVQQALNVCIQTGDSLAIPADESSNAVTAWMSYIAGTGPTTADTGWGHSLSAWGLSGNSSPVSH